MCLPWSIALLLGVMFQEAAPEIAAPLLAMDPPWARFLTGDWIILTCNPARRLRSTKYVWNINEHGDKPGNRTYIIRTATENDSGVYKCKVISSASTPNDRYSNTILVNVTDPDSEMTIEVESDKLWVDENLVLRCKFQNLLQSEFIYTFYREGSILTEIRSWNRSVAIEMEHITLEHEGRYRCEVQFAEFPNRPAYSSGYKFVRVRESPVRLDVDPETPRDGDTIALRCVCTECSKSGSKEYYFYRNKFLMYSASGISDVYRIQRATVMDSDWYHCAIGSDTDVYPSRHVHITVKGPTTPMRSEAQSEPETTTLTVVLTTGGEEEEDDDEQTTRPEEGTEADAYGTPLAHLSPVGPAATKSASTDEAVRPRGFQLATPRPTSLFAPTPPRPGQPGQHTPPPADRIEGLTKLCLESVAISRELLQAFGVYTRDMSQASARNSENMQQMIQEMRAQTAAIDALRHAIAAEHSIAPQGAAARTTSASAQASQEEALPSGPPS
uniref:high affinity immunoglobulin gamma Fc receptor I-like n=1 Tax=Pristiophorus japonicus TaxID=55135 RepID=UPI00398F4709